jgi:hypothetical protein
LLTEQPVDEGQIGGLLDATRFRQGAGAGRVGGLVAPFCICQRPNLYSTTVDNIRDFNVKMIDMAQANAEAQLATAKQPSDMVELWTAHAKKQFETLTEQTKELSALGQKIAGESAEPITRGVNQAFKKAS